MSLEQLAREIESFVGLLETNGLKDEVTQFHGLILRASEARANEVYQQALADGYALAMDLYNRGKLSPEQIKDAIIPEHVKLMGNEYAARKLN